ncbi:Extracellular membrane protein, CFEM domain [Penicillium griseofulvum]|uniref:Extracellular membrane protein, CFEM domain n=1 Tax=Penicillium patulum TaxID=5078 RepID=A0A135LV19_PENPA|nr:Extracellular membrane protein, CFEM domain [Penicillium griseofulvum]KXG52812.1 Extracellular membrane protein, CFEM domain [Penicillium griseofulvum]
MKFSTSLIALVAAGLASAQLPDVPACSLSCFVSALGGDGCSELLDFECHCQKPELVSTITPCVEKACEYEDQVSVSNAVTDQCKSAGHPISIPPIKSDGGEESSTAAPTTTSAAETTAKPTETSESSSAVETGSSSAVETGSSSAVAPPPGTTSTGSTSVGSSSGVATSTPLVSKTGAAPSSSSPAFNGAGSVKGNMAGVAAIAAAAAYVL